ncbi:P-loop containing nucleoside triphosphate hydrolases superfamily protein [Tasmannia lanceolata]|uniref:P-loop containing nucleoside triphosphate hydrolases superfamily protein n=1 Tax=Tasmannia lanceolata TaxID=3420 RepID=UPI0040642F51
MGGGSKTLVSDLENTPLLSSSPSSSTMDGCDSLCDIGVDVFENVGKPLSDSFVARRQRCKIYREIMLGYENLKTRAETLFEAKNEILGYYPGAWIEKVGGLKRTDYDIPSTTTLLLVGPRGSGKSTLVNRISKVLEDDKFTPDRAQVSYKLSVGAGTCFLQEYMIPRGSNSFCVYDTRSLSEKVSENNKLLKSWMTEGVQHGQMVVRGSDDSIALRVMKQKVRHTSLCTNEKRMINFVIFVVDGLLVHKSMVSGETPQYTDMLAKAFNCPYLSFKDDKPLVVVTHGDELTLSDRACVRIYLGDLLGVPPDRQIFDIPDECDLATELTIVDMLRYSLEHADRNLPLKHKAPPITVFHVFLVVIIQALLIVIIYIYRSYALYRSQAHINWHAIRHLWLG